jgi:DNA-directed RNA polymerase specialized sigma subunit
VEDAMQQAALELVQNNKVAGYAYQSKAAANRLRDVQKRPEHVSLEELVHNLDDSRSNTQLPELVYDPYESLEMTLDVSRILAKHFNAKEREIIVSYFAEGVSVRQIARENPIRSNSTWLRWLEKIVKPLLREELKAYADIFKPETKKLKEAV